MPQANDAIARGDGDEDAEKKAGAVKLVSVTHKNGTKTTDGDNMLSRKEKKQIQKITANLPQGK